MERRRKAIAKLVKIHGQVVVDAALCGQPRISDNALVKLSNMWRERAVFILSQLSEGTSFTSADRKSAEIYDTCHWGEIISRLARARGHTLGNAARLAHQGKRIVQCDEQRQSLIEQASAVKVAARRLIRLLDKNGPEQCNGEPQPVVNSELALFDAAKPVALGKVKGQLTLARVFIAKCVRDLPDITAKTTLLPTTAERARINIEAARIAVGAELIACMCERKQLGAVKRPDGNGRDRLGVGRRYSPWLNYFSRRQDCATVAGALDLAGGVFRSP